MKVLLYTEGYKKVKKSGLGKAINHQMQALDSEKIEYTTNLDDDYDIIHINTWWLKSYFVAKKAKKMGKKVVYHAHSTEEDFKNSFIFSNLVSKIVKWWLIKCYSLGDVIITPTPYSKKLLEHYKGLENKKIYAISNGIDLSLFKKDKRSGDKFRKEYGYSKTDKVIIGIGLYIRRKGIVDFVELAKRMPEYKFIWFGYSPLSVATKDVKKAVNTKLDNLTFAGYVDQDMIKAALNGCDLYVFPTYEETEGIPIIEACAVGANAIIRDIKIFDEWLKDGKNVYKAKDVDEFEVKIKKILSGKLKSVTTAAKEVAKERDIKEVGKQLKKVYQGVLKKTKTKEQDKFKKESNFKLRNWAILFTSILLIIALFMCKDKFNFTLNEYNKTIDGYNIKIYAQSKNKADKTFKDIEGIIDEYQDYNKENGEIDFIKNNTDESDKITISANLYKMLVYFDDYYTSFEENLDLYMADYVDLWNNSEDIPVLNQVESTRLKFLGNNQILNNHPRIYVDSYIDGYIITEIENYLDKNNINKYLISKDSVISAGKHKDKKEKYLIAIASPFKDSDDVLQIVKFTNKAIATKGIYQKSIQINGQDYSNIISPKTLQPANNMISVTVIAPNAVLAELISTELFLIDVEEGMEYINNHDDLEAIWCYYLEDGNYNCTRSEKFDDVI